MSLVFRYKFDEPTASLTTDSSGNSNTLVNVGSVVSVSDSTYGNVAHFEGSATSQMTLSPTPVAMSGSALRTFSVWVKKYNQDLEIIYGSLDLFRVQFQTPGVKLANNNNFTAYNQAFVTGQWYHIVVTYDGSTERLYVNGTLNGSTVTDRWNFAYNTGNDSFMIGGVPPWAPDGGSYTLTGDMSDFRLYDDALSATEINSLYTSGPNPVPLTLTPGVSSIKAEVNGDQVYRLTISEDGSSSTRVTHDGISFETVTIKSLQPETNYVVTLFSGSEEIESISAETLPNVAESYDKSNFGGENGAFDLSDLDTSELALLSDVINEVFSTGDKLEVKVGGNGRLSEVTFVKRGEAISTDDSILAPFNSSSGSGQVFTMQLSDSTVQVAYDETDNSLMISGQVVEVGGSVVVDGKKCTVADLETNF